MYNSLTHLFFISLSNSSNLFSLILASIFLHSVSIHTPSTYFPQYILTGMPIIRVHACYTVTHLFGECS
jgi:hypothetical protein